MGGEDGVDFHGSSLTALAHGPAGDMLEAVNLHCLEQINTIHTNAEIAGSCCHPTAWHAGAQDTGCK